MLALHKASYWYSGLSADNWIGIASVLATIVAVIVAAVMAHRYTTQQQKQSHKLALEKEELTQTLTHQNQLEQNRLVHNLAVKSDRLRREIDALEAVWRLLAYMCAKKSEKAIIHWEKRRGDAETTHFFHYYNYEHFLLHETSDVFYTQHAGLFMPADVKKLLYDYQFTAATFYFNHPEHEEIPENGLVQINDPERVNKLTRIYQQLNQRLREELDQRYKSLVV